MKNFKNQLEENKETLNHPKIRKIQSCYLGAKFLASCHSAYIITESIDIRPRDSEILTSLSRIISPRFYYFPNTKFYEDYIRFNLAGIAGEHFAELSFNDENDILTLEEKLEDALDSETESILYTKTFMETQDPYINELEWSKISDVHIVRRLHNYLIRTFDWLNSHRLELSIISNEISEKSYLDKKDLKVLEQSILDLAFST